MSMMRIWTLGVCSFILASCGQAEQTDMTDPSPTGISVTPTSFVMETQATPTPIAQLAGRHCYFLADKNTDEGADITFHEDGRIEGEHFGIIHMEDDAYYAAFDTRLSNGALTTSGHFQFDTVTHVDGDTQYEEDTWIITELTAQRAGVEAEPLQKTQCEGLKDKVYGPPLD